MEAIQCIKERRSVRKFTEEAIPDELIREIIEAASYAPSWKHTQTPRYTVIKDREIMNTIAETGVLDFKMDTDIIHGCTELVVVSYINGRSGYDRDGSFSTPKEDRWQMFDAGVATQTFCLAAHAKGVASVIMGYLDEEIIAPLINLPENETPAVLIAIGYAAESPAAPKRKDVDTLLRIL